MCSIVIGDKLKATEKLTVTDKLRVKSKNLPKEKKDCNLDVYVSAIVGDVGIAQLGGMPMWGYGLSLTGGVVTLWTWTIKIFGYYRVPGNVFECCSG